MAMLTHWRKKFRCAFHGLWLGVSGHSSFWVHLPATAAVVLAAWWLECSGWQWSVLAVCIGLIWSLELLNSSIEHLARGLCTQQNVEVGKALDTASAAVLIASMISAGIGLSILGSRLAEYLGYWGG
ncbi:MAG: diacylglycerol kinase [Pirellulaceae bacterium]|nr:diacylglycerol kinase [Pirellulaceae bacterium]